jgi:hypothetical protein
MTRKPANHVHALVRWFKTDIVPLASMFEVVLRSVVFVNCQVLGDSWSRRKWIGSDGGKENKQKKLNKQLHVSVNKRMLANMCTYLVIREHKVAA